MSQDQPQLNASQPIIESNATMAQAFREFTQLVAQAVTIVGTGNPEGALNAPQYSVYVDETVPAVPVTYRKMLTSIAGDTTKGWIVV